jgi:putative DNA-invertase from lambdoid prophage Rac
VKCLGLRVRLESRAETISGSLQASARPVFAKLLERLEPGDVLVVTKLDRLGRNAIDVRQTVEQLAGRGVRVHCLALGGVNLTSPAGKMTMQVIAAVAEFERDLLVERTQAGLARAKGEGKSLGRPARLSEKQRKEVARRLQAGETVSGLAREFGIDRALSSARARPHREIASAHLAEIRTKSSSILHA